MNNNLFLEQVDIRDTEKLIEVFEKHAPVVSVFHFAGNGSHSHMKNTISLLRAMHEAECKEIFYSSSC